MKKNLLIFIFVFSLLFSILNSNNVTYAIDNNNVTEDTELPKLNVSFNATSASEFFNETSFPRYALAARPMGMIKYPNKVNPAIKIYDEEINIITSGSSEANTWNFTMIDANTSLSLNILESEYIDGMWYFTTLPEIQREGLYDLQLNCSEGDDYQTHAIQILEEQFYPFTFVHVSDTHFPAYYEDFNTTDINLQEIENIIALDPDFVIVTGDLIQGPTAYFLDPETGKPLRSEIQYRLAIWALDLFNKPVFYIHGNHEFIKSSLIPDDPGTNYFKYFGTVVYQNFTFLDWSFVGFGSEWSGLSQAEYDAVFQILAQNSDGATVLYYHYDFADHATSLHNKFPIELALYGHEHHEDLYLSKNTLYHLQAPLFDREFTLFSILNETSLTVDSQTFNFELLPYVPPEPVETTPVEFIFFGPSMMILALMVNYSRKKK